MDIAIIYHDADFDGKLSREVCLHWLSKLHPDAKLDAYGWDYGRPVPEIGREIPSGPNMISADSRMMTWEDYDEIYIVDLSVDELMARPELHDKIVWIDHHASAIKKWDDDRKWVHEPAGKDSFGSPYKEFWRHEHETRTTPPPTSKLAGYRIDGVAACRLCWKWFTHPAFADARR